MPVGRGGGSHFRGGGGGRSGGSHFSSSRSSSRGFSRGHSTVVVFGGGGRSHSSNSRMSKASAFVFFIIFVALFLVAGIAITVQSNKGLDIIREDRQFYLNLIATGERDDNAKVTGVRFNHDCDKYYIEFTFNYYGNEVEGYSFSVYDSYQDAPDPYSRISVAYGYRNGVLDAIPTDYANFSLNDDGEYVDLKGDRGFGICLTVVLSAVEVVLIIFFIRSLSKKQEENELPKSSPEDIAQSNASYKRVCSYCGTTLKFEAEKCPNCGAQSYEIKK